MDLTLSFQYTEANRPFQIVSEFLFQSAEMEGYSNNPNREEARIMAHAEKFAQRKAGSGVVRAPQPRHEEPTPVHHGRNVRIVWVDRDTGAAKDTCVTMLTRYTFLNAARMQIETDRLGRIPAEFLKANWGVTNLYWKDTELLVHVCNQEIRTFVSWAHSVFSGHGRWFFGDWSSGYYLSCPPLR